MTWLDDYRARLDAIQTTAPTTGRKSIYDIANSVTRSASVMPTARSGPVNQVSQDQWDAYNPFEKLLHSETAANVLGNPAVHNVIDWLSRPGYATRNAWIDTEQDPINAWLAGFKGDKETTGIDVLAKVGVKDSQPDVNEAGDWIRALSGFGIDVASDPLTYVGVGWIRDMAKGLADQVGLKGTNFVKNEAASLDEAGRAADTAMEVNPIAQAQKELAATGTTTVPDNVAEKIISETNKAANEAENIRATPVPEWVQPALPDMGEASPLSALSRGEVPRLPEAPPGSENPLQGVLDLQSPSTKPGKYVQGGKDYSREMNQIMLNADKNVQQQALNVTARRYDPAKVTSPFKDIPEVVTTTPGKSAAKQAIRNAAARILYQDAATDGKLGITVNEAGDYISKADGTVQTAEDMQHAIDALAAKPKIMEKFAIDLVDKEGTATQKISPGTYAHDLINGQSKFGDQFIYKNDQIVPFSNYATEKSMKYAFNEAAGTTEVTPAIKNAKFTPEEKAAWQKDMKEYLSPEDYKYLIAGSHQPGNFETRLAKVLNKTQTRNYENLDALEAASKAGEVSKEEVAKVLKQYDAKTIAGAKRKAAELDARIAKFEAKVPEAKGTVEAKAADVIAETPKTVEDNLAEQGIKPAAEIVKDEATTGHSMLDSIDIKAGLTAEQQRAVLHALRAYSNRDIVRVLEQFKVITKQGARKSPPLKEAQFDSFNIRNAITTNKELIHQASLLLQGKFMTPKNAPKGEFNKVQAARRAAMYDTLMPMIKASEDTLRFRGIEPILGEGKTGLPLSLHDVLSTLPRHVVENYFMTKDKAIPVTQWLQMAEQLVKFVRGGSTEEGAREALYSIDKILGSQIGRRGTDRVQETNLTKFTDRTIAKNPDLGSRIANTERARLIGHLFDAAPSLAQKVELNSARLGIDYGKKVKALEIGTLKQFADQIAQAGNMPTKLLEVIDNLDESVNNAVKVGGFIPPPGAAEMALANVHEVAASTYPVAEMKVMAQAGKETAKGNGLTAVRESLEAAEQEAGNIFNDLTPVADLNEMLEMADGIHILRSFFPHMANAHVRPILLGTESLSKTLAYKYHDQLNQISQRYAKGEIQDAFYRIQAGQADLIANPRVKQAAVELEQIIDLAFSTDPKIGKLAREGISPQHMNQKMGHFGAGDKYRFQGSTYEEAMNSWKQWTNVEDPLLLLSRTYGAAMAAHSENLLGARISKLFGSKTPGKDMVRITDSGGASRIAKLIDTNLYYHKDIAKELRVLDTTLHELVQPVSQNKALKTFDAVTHMYKTQLTIYRPGHHARNTYGDTWLGMMDGMFSPRWYRKGLGIMSARSSVYSDWGGEAAAEVAREFSTKPVASFKWKNTKTGKIETKELTREEAYRLAFDQGMFPTFQILEDLGMATNTGFDFTRSGISGNLRWINPVFYAEKMSGGRIKPGDVHRTAGKLSELRDHYHRAAHFAYALDKNPVVEAADLEEALLRAGSAASQRVKKWHPDGSDYSHFEQQVMRRTVLFYSWMRKAIPLVVEAHAFTPGRALLYPKAMYALAEANGIDLQNGFGDPFPLDQLFPSWMQDTSQGPTMGDANQGYFGLKPGIPGPDILDGYFNARAPGSIVNTMGGNLNPAIKAPIEIMTHDKGAFARDLRLGGSPVETPADYIAKQLPNSSLLENLTDRSIPGTSPDAKSNVGYEPQLDFGGKTLDSNAIGIANWLTGLGITDMSKPSYKASAKKEATQKRAQFIKDSKK